MTILEMELLAIGYSTYLRDNRKKLCALKVAALEAEIKLWLRAIEVAEILESGKKYLYPVRNKLNFGFEHIYNGNDRIIVRNLHKLKINLTYEKRREQSASY